MLYDKVGNEFGSLHPFLKSGIYASLLATQQTKFAQDNGGSANGAYQSATLGLLLHEAQHSLVGGEIGGTGESARHDYGFAAIEGDVSELDVGDDAQAMTAYEEGVASDVDEFDIGAGMAQYVEGAAGFCFLEALGEKEVDQVGLKVRGYRLGVIGSYRLS